MNFTKNQLLILNLFFSRPEGSFYMHEIGRLIDKKPGVFQRDLNSLEKRGVITSNFKANARYFELNKKYPLYRELKSIVFKTIGIEGSVRNLINSLSGIEKAILFGSFASGKTDEFSDIDILVVGTPDIEELTGELRKLENKFGREINYIIYSRKEYEKKLKKKDPFLVDILRNKNIILKDDTK